MSPLARTAAAGRGLSWESLSTAVLGLAMVFAAMPSLQVSNPPVITYSDVLLVLGFVMLMPRLLTGRATASAAYLIGALMILCTALASFALVQQPGQFQGLLRISYAIVVLPCAFMMWRPSVWRIGFLMACYLLGATISVIDGVITGPGGDGRTTGLAPHPNALGHAALISITLVPFLTAVHPPSRWFVRFGGGVCLYGIWLSGSRGSLIALGLVTLVYILVERSVATAAFAWGVGIAFVLVAPRLAQGSGNNALTRVLGGGTASDATGQRSLALREAMNQISAHPFLGNGFSTIRAAQDAYVQITAALGLIALIGLLLILLGFGLPVLTASDPIRLLSYVAVAYALLAPFTDVLSDTMIWAPMSMCILVRPAREPREASSWTRDEGPLSAPAVAS